MQQRSEEQSAQDELARIFNTTIVSTKNREARDFSEELAEAMDRPAFQCLLNAIRQHARIQGISEQRASEEVIRVFRDIDLIWSDYLRHEGTTSLRQ